MIVAVLTFKVPLEQINESLSEHRAFLDRYYAQNTFICSGRCEANAGGVILMRSDSEAAARAIVEEDPYYTRGLAEYAFYAFTPSKWDPHFERYVEPPQ
ncbi:MAG: GTP cyclohydrolase [Clostridiales bacterium]|nr:GTP cyclohydrolase [Clostridiales bacterium]